MRSAAAFSLTIFTTVSGEAVVACRPDLDGDLGARPDEPLQVGDHLLGQPAGVAAESVGVDGNDAVAPPGPPDRASLVCNRYCLAVRTST